MTTMSRIDFSRHPSEMEDPNKPDPPLDAAGLAREEKYQQMRRIMTEYLQPDSSMSLNEAIERLAPLYDDSGNYMVNVLVLVIDLADKIPYDHTSHRKLADFVVAFSKSDKWRAQSTKANPERAEFRYWDNLGIYLYEQAMTFPEAYAEDGDDPLIYANMRAFLAELAWPNEPFSFFWARVAMEVALEEDQSDSTVGILDARVIGAAQYILRQAPIIFAESLKSREQTPVMGEQDSVVPKLEQSDRFRVLKKSFRVIKRSLQLVKMPLQTVREFISSFYANPVLGQRERAPDFTWSRWQAWKRGFEDVAASDMYGQECRMIAQRAASLMAFHQQTAVGVDISQSHAEDQNKAIEKHIEKF